MKKMFVSLLGISLTLGLQWQVWAQEKEVVLPLAEIPPQVISDGGVEAVRDAQEMATAPNGKMKEALAVLKAQAKSKGWKQGWDDKKKRIIVFEMADFETADPATDKSLFIKREMAVKKAILSAKVTIIQTINQDMSAMDLVNMPGADINKALGAEGERLNADLIQVKEDIAKLLEKIDNAAAAELRRTTFGDHLNDIMVAAIKKLDKDYTVNGKNAKTRADYITTKSKFEVVLKKYEELKKNAETMQENILERQESVIESMAKMPLYGSSVIMQSESWNKQTRKYQVAVMLCWSYALERSARAIVTGEEFRIKPSVNAESVEDWLGKQNLVTMVGPRQYIDDKGNRWFLGITARPCDDELTSSERRKNRGLADMFAQQMAAFCVWADVESYKMAKQALESRGDKTMQRDIVAEHYAEKLTQSFENKKIRGMRKLFGEEMVHPITGTTNYVAVYGLHPNDVKTALEIEKENYVTKVMDNRYLTVEDGRDAANRNAVEASQGRLQDFQEGYEQQKKKVTNELQKRQQSAPPAKKATSTPGTYIDNTEYISDDF